MFKSLLKTLWLLGLCTLLVLGLRYLGHHLHFDKQWIDDAIINAGWMGQLYFVLVAALALSLGIPRQFSAFLGGYAFGFSYGVALSTLAALVSCVATFFCARFLLRPYILRKFAKRIATIDQFLTDDVFHKTVAIRLLPVGNNLITNLVAGVTRADALPFFGGSAVGYLPQMIIFALVGNGVTLLAWWKFGLSAVLMVVSVAISAQLYLKYKRALKLEQNS